ncbi:MAG: dTDP-4-dehydrorhamnose reductase [Fimbriimonadaceae bacterium]
MPDSDQTGEVIELFPDMTSSTPLNVLLFGGTGMLGYDVDVELSHRGHHVVAPMRSQFDVTVPQHYVHFEKKRDRHFDWIINCAAYTAVDQAETETMAAMKMNAVAPGALAALAKNIGARFLHISTDFVFDGLAESPYTEDRTTNPLSTYGKSKLLGEQNVQKENPDSVIMRTSWLYGKNGKSFPRTMIEAYQAGKNLRVVADQTGCPTSTVDLARVIVDAIEKPVQAGIYHACGPEAMNWHQFASLSIQTFLDSKQDDAQFEIQPITTSDWPVPARRPQMSVLDCSKLLATGIAPMRTVQESLVEFVARTFLEQEP